MQRLVAAAALLVFVGCGSSKELVVTVSAGNVGAALVDPDCSCGRLPALGECQTIDDSDTLCDRCSTSCDELTATRSADGATLQIDGCGKHAELAIPTVFPATPTGTAEAIPDGTRVTWQVDAMTSQVFLSGSGGSTAEDCLLPPEPNTHDLHKASFLGGGITLVAETYGPVVETPFGSTRVRADSAFARIMPPPR